MQEEGLKTCRLCQVEKPLSEFRFRKDNQKHRNDCKACQRQYETKYRKENSEAVKEGVRKWHKENKERIKEYRIANFKREKFRSIMKNYGVSEDMFYERLFLQDNSCAICGTVFTEGVNPYVDHCHSTNVFRGLLCMICNTGLGHFKDNIDNLIKATKYLQEAEKRIKETIEND